jgi:hypothetical protein
MFPSVNNSDTKAYPDYNSPFAFPIGILGRARRANHRSAYVDYLNRGRRRSPPYREARRSPALAWSSDHLSHLGGCLKAGPHKD